MPVNQNINFKMDDPFYIRREPAYSGEGCPTCPERGRNCHDMIFNLPDGANTRFSELPVDLPCGLCIEVISKFFLTRKYPLTLQLTPEGKVNRV